MLRFGGRGDWALLTTAELGFIDEFIVTLVQTLTVEVDYVIASALRPSFKFDTLLPLLYMYHLWLWCNLIFNE